MRHSYLLYTLFPIAMAFKDDNVHRIRGPEPTAAPNPLQVEAMLEKRAVGSNTCGWVDGITLDSVTCNLGYQCAYNLFYTAFGCCSGAVSTCVLATTCLDRTDVASLTTVPDRYTFLCAQALAPSCNTYIYPGGFSGYGCDVTEGLFSVSLTLPGGESAGGITTAVSLPATLSGTAATVTVVGPGAAQTSPSSPVASGSGGGGGGGGKLSTGAIVGIAIAGAVVAITAIAVIGFVCYKRNKNKRPTVVAQQQQPMYQPGFPPKAPLTNVSSSHPGSPGPQSSHMSYMSAGPQSVTTGVPTASHAGSGVSQPMTQANMDAMLAGQQQQTGEWAYIQKPVPQSQSAAAAQHDGIVATEIMPEDAPDEQPPQVQQHPASPGPVQHTGSPVPFSSPGSPTLVHSTGSPGPAPFHTGSSPSQFGQQTPHEDVMSTVAPTAVAPTAISHPVQNA